MSLVIVTDKVVTRCLLGGIESCQRHTEVSRTKHSVEGAGQLLTIQCPEKRAGVDAKFGVDPAAGCQVRPNAKYRVLRVDDCYIWRRVGGHGY